MPIVQEVSAISDIPDALWQTLAATTYPFMQRGFLQALEESGSVSASAGWKPRHLLVKDDTTLLAFLPMYEKSHSYGEYVFDWAWADAYQRHGFPYYPKLVTAIPFTPVAGPRWLLHPKADRKDIVERLMNKVAEISENERLSGWHVLFPDDCTANDLKEQPLIERNACQYRWHNPGYQTFDDFLAALSSRKRKNLRKERRDVAAQGFQFHRISGRDMTPERWEDFYRFYQSTYMVRGMQGYLSSSFFTMIQEAIPDSFFLVFAVLDQKPVAGAIFFTGDDTLYGRYWGCDADYMNLHFETCYYQGIDYCIENGMTLFDAGAQGEHKLKRGFYPIITKSFHKVMHPGFEEAIASFCHEEKGHVESYAREAAALLPYKNESDH